MINYVNKKLFMEDSVDKQIIIDCEGKIITNEDIYSEQFELKESLNSQNELRFGSCEPSVVKFRINNDFSVSMKGKIINITEVLNGDSANVFKIGTYEIYDDVSTVGGNYRDITAYDSLYKIINTDVIEWYNSLSFPITLKDFRDSFFDYFGIEQVLRTLINDEMLIDKTIDGNSLSGKTVITSLCEINGVFGHINRENKFDYISLPMTITTRTAVETKTFTNQDDSEGYVIYSSIWSGREPYKVSDGNLSTFWSTKATENMNGEYIGYMFEDYVSEAEIDVTFSSDNSDAKFHIEGLSPFGRWEKITDSISSNMESSHTITFNITEGKYKAFRIYFTQGRQSSTYGLAVYEIDINGYVIKEENPTIYPGVGLYPEYGVYPGMTINIDSALFPSKYTNLKLSDYETKKISQIKIKQTSSNNSADFIYGDEGNTYVINENFLLYGKTSDDLTAIAKIILRKISSISYVPFQSDSKGNPCFEVGDLVTLVTRNNTYKSYYFERTIKGVQSLKDAVTAKGVKQYSENVNSLKDQVIQMKGKTNELSRTLEETKSTITNLEEDLQTQITQNEEKIESKVSKGEVSSSISQESDKITILGNRLIVQSDNFNLDEDGNLSISGKYEVVFERTYYATDYTEDDLNRAKQISIGAITPTEDDLLKYDFKGTGVDALSLLYINKFVLGAVQWRTIRYSITIDPKERKSLIYTRLTQWTDVDSEETEIGFVKIGGAGISVEDVFSQTYNTENSSGGLEVGKSGQFTTADGKTVTVTNGIITNIA